MGFFRGKNAKTLTMMVAIAIVIVMLYSVLTKKEEGKNSQLTVEAATEVSNLMDKDLKENYPASVREVVKMYCRVITCFYNEELSDDELTVLADKERALFDQTLLENNTYSDFIKRLQAEIENYKNNKTTIINYQINTNKSVQYWWNNDRECASIMVVINLNGKSLQQVYEKFILRKDDKGQWKILGWQLSNEEEYSTTETAKK